MIALLRVSLAFLCNFASGPATVLSNKSVFTHAHFHYPVALTICHYVFTWLTVRLLARFGVYERMSLQLLPPKADSPAKDRGMESLQHCVECFLVPEFGWHVSNGETADDSIRGALGLCHVWQKTYCLASCPAHHGGFWHQPVHCFWNPERRSHAFWSGSGATVDTFRSGPERFDYPRGAAARWHFTLINKRRVHLDGEEEVVAAVIAVVVAVELGLSVPGTLKGRTPKEQSATQSFESPVSNEAVSLTGTARLGDQGLETFHSGVSSSGRRARGAAAESGPSLAEIGSRSKLEAVKGSVDKRVSTMHYQRRAAGTETREALTPRRLRADHVQRREAELQRCPKKAPVSRGLQV
ncbi:unnamed protein product [Symbiodinium necroappetens]|uniref:Transmembrane protein n=1 Tax=Symbiodinium necroappetens TaxID=1628268 RepID=A0A812SKQ1_9DINO|nr:unnamed protein product [Symbiodinium necroappetens]